MTKQNGAAGPPIPAPKSPLQQGRILIEQNAEGPGIRVSSNMKGPDVWKVITQWLTQALETAIIEHYKVTQGQGADEKKIVVPTIRPTGQIRGIH